MGRGALLLVTLSGCSLLVDSSRYTGGRADGGRDGAPRDAAASECGNGAVETGEECDDDNTDDGDGCTADCGLEVTMGRGGCDVAAMLNLAPTASGYSARAMGTTGEGTSMIDPVACMGAVEPRPGALEQAFRIDLPEPGNLMLSVEPLGGWDTVLYVHPSCVRGVDDIVCSDDNDNGIPENITQRLPRNTYYVVVDGFEPGESGYYELLVLFTPDG